MFTRTVHPMLCSLGSCEGSNTHPMPLYYNDSTSHQRLKHAAPIREVVFEMSDPPTAHTATAKLHPATLKVPFLLDDGILDTVN